MSQTVRYVPKTVQHKSVIKILTYSEKMDKKTSFQIQNNPYFRALE